jgi:hypothetical protein
MRLIQKLMVKIYIVHFVLYNSLKKMLKYTNFALMMIKKIYL